MHKQIFYREGYKYQLYENYLQQTGIVPNFPFMGEFLSIDESGLLICYRGYAWDGASGPTVDDASNMRASLVHDALCQLMRLGVVSRKYRLYADHLLATICLEDGMHPARALLYEKAVNWFGADASKAESERPVLVAPKLCTNFEYRIPDFLMEHQIA